jgi:uncharacterized protein (DUF305 family)
VTLSRFTNRRTAVLLVPLSIYGCSVNKSAPKNGSADKPAAASVVQQSMPGMSSLPAVTIPKDADYTVADVHFMQGMIAHHGQAIYMSQLAKAHGANPHVLELSAKIDQSQKAEISLMQGWLRANDQVTPDTSYWRHMSMPGMLNAEQIRELESAQGPAFDHAYLTYMIQHHEGALKMVDDLFATPMAGQDIDVSVFANDVVVVQTAEINAMKRMLASEANAN